MVSAGIQYVPLMCWNNKTVSHGSFVIFKEVGSKFITSISHEEWKDDHVHDFTFAETEEIVKQNIGGMVIVGIIFIFDSSYHLFLLFKFCAFKDERCVQASLCSLAEA